jgi:murein DD-endopeptidase MepM/ murein hydrolase activator NlpD
MAGRRAAPRPSPRAGRFLGCLIALSTLTTASLFADAAPAGAITVEQLRVQRDLARAELIGARWTEAHATRSLADAREAYLRAHDQVQQAAAEIWMMVAEAGAPDPALVEGLATAVDRARYAVELAEVDVARAERKLAGAQVAVRAAERAAARRERSERTTTQTRTSGATTIACPVEVPSAIYADFGAPRPGGPHTGIDIPAPHGTAARAAWYAIVEETPLGGWMGKGVILRDGGGNRWLYAHLESIAVLPGEIVRRGQAVGRVGSTGNSTGSHLHFEVHVGGTTPVDPYPITSAACAISDPLGPSARVAHEASTPEAGSA